MLDKKFIKQQPSPSCHWRTEPHLTGRKLVKLGYGEVNMLNKVGQIDLRNELMTIFRMRIQQLGLETT